MNLHSDAPPSEDKDLTIASTKEGETRQRCILCMHTDKDKKFRNA